MCLLILGGTADGRLMAEVLHQKNVPVIYSVAGLVRMPTVTCDVVSDGYKQFGGLSVFIKERGVTAILDVTHPYAATMSETAVNVAKNAGIPCWRFHRESWQSQSGDNWLWFESWQTLLPELKNKSSLFLTAGQLEQSVVDELAANTGQVQLLRTAVKPKTVLAKSMQWLKAIGPFEKEDELALMEKYKIDALVCKDSGGEATVAKLHVARKLGIQVYLLKRPILPPADQLFISRAVCETFVLEKFNCLV